MSRCLDSEGKEKEKQHNRTVLPQTHPNQAAHQQAGLPEYKKSIFCLMYKAAAEAAATIPSQQQQQQHPSFSKTILRKKKENRGFGIGTSTHRHVITAP